MKCIFLEPILYVKEVLYWKGNIYISDQMNWLVKLVNKSKLHGMAIYIRRYKRYDSLLIY